MTSDSELEQPAHEAGPAGRRGCLAVLLALAVLVGGGYLVACRRARRDPAPVRRARGLPRPRQRLGAGRGRRTGDTATDIARPWSTEDVVKSAEAFTEAARDEPDAGRDPGRLLRAQASRWRPRTPWRCSSTPTNLMQSVGDDPRGSPGRAGRRGAGREDRLHQAGSFSAALDAAREARSARRTPRATRRATCSRRPTPSVPTPRPVDLLAAMVDRWRAGGRRGRPRGRARTRWATPRPSS